MKAGVSKRVLIDVTVLAQGIETGVYRVTDALVRHLVSDLSVEVFFTLTRENDFTRRGLDLRERLQAYSRSRGIRAPFINSEIDPAFTDIDVYVSTFFEVPPAWASEERVVKAVVVYDLIPILHPEYCQDGINRLMRDFFAHIKGDWLVFAISEATKSDLLRHRPDLQAENVIVTPLGADARFRAHGEPDALARVRKRYGIPASAPYLLSVATLEIRKNLTAVLDGFSRYVRESGDTATVLVLSGMQGWKLENLSNEIARRPGLRDRVILTGFVDDDYLPALYSGAQAFLFMSLYEGFGLPPLEAMSCGIPVIVSNRSSLPEVVGEAGIQLEPGDTVGLAEALARVLGDSALRCALSRQSLQQASKFSWGRFGNTVVQHLLQREGDPKPFLSIITICFNEEHLRDTCESVARQTYRRFEWLVIDGGSDNVTLATLEAYRDHIDYLISEPDRGRYDAMNKGIRRSRGKYLLFLNAGDYLHAQDTLETIFRYSVPFEMMSLFSLKLNADVVYGEVIARETGMMPHPMWRTGPQVHDLEFFAANSLPHQATFIRRSMFERYGLYDDTLLYAADYEWFIRVLAHHRARSQYLPAIVSVYNFAGTSSTSIAADAPHIVEIRTVFGRYQNPSNRSPELLRGRSEFGACLIQGASNPVEAADHLPARSDARAKRAGKPGARDLHSGERVECDRLLTLAGERLCEAALRDLVKQCDAVLAGSKGTGQAEDIQLRFHGKDLSRDAVHLLILRTARLLGQQSCETDRVPYRRLLLYLRERLTAFRQRHHAASDVLVAEVDPVASNRHFRFSRLIGLSHPPLAESEDYHLTQLALRCIAREKFGEKDMPSELAP